MTEKLRRYETLILAIPEITNDESREVEKALDDMIRTGQGSTVSYDRWGKYRLAYPINKQDYGVYYLARYDLPESSAHTTLDELKNAFAIKFNKMVMRSMTTELDPKASLEYQRPESLEETPKDVDTFLRENKMDGLISRDRGSRGPRKPREEAVAAAPASEAAQEETKEEQPKVEAADVKED